MRDEIPFGFVGWGRDVGVFVVHNGFVYHECKSQDWDKLSDYPFPVKEFSEVIHYSMLREIDSRTSYKLLKKDIPDIEFRLVDVLVKELKWRGVRNGQISLIMHPLLFEDLAFIVAQSMYAIGDHYQEMLSKQALLLNGVFIPVRFCRFLPEFRISYDDIVEMIVVADTTGYNNEAELEGYVR